MLTDATANAALDIIAVSGAGNMYLSAHTDYSETGTNMTGAKTSANFAAAASRSKALAANCDITIGAGVTAKWVGMWDSTQATFKGMVPNNGADFNFQVDLTNNKILCEGNAYANGDKITFHGAAAPTGLTAGTTYFVVGQTAADPDTFQVAATLGGAAIDITGQHAAGCKVSKIIEETFSAAGTLRVTTFTITL